MVRPYQPVTKQLHNFLVAGALLLSVASSAQKDVTFSGFLKDYMGFEPNEMLDGAPVYATLAPQGDF